MIGSPSPSHERKRSRDSVNGKEDEKSTGKDIHKEYEKSTEQDIHNSAFVNHGLFLIEALFITPGKIHFFCWLKFSYESIIMTFSKIHHSLVRVLMAFSSEPK